MVYIYDGHNRRVKKNTTTASYSVYNKSGQLLLTDGPQGITRYIYLGSKLIARIGNVAATEDKPGYTGHLEDDDLSLTYMQQRYYDPVIGRFYSNDPVDALSHLNGANGTAGFNRYAYANNNPYKFVDPDGRSSYNPNGMSESIARGSAGSAMLNARAQSMDKDGGARTFSMALGAASVTACAVTPCGLGSAALAVIGGGLSLGNGAAGKNLLSGALQSSGVDEVKADGAAAAVDLAVGGRGLADDVVNSAKAVVMANSAELVTKTAVMTANTLQTGKDSYSNLDKVEKAVTNEKKD